MKRILGSVILVASAWAEDGIRGPVPGFVFDEHTKALRPMIGMPGASYLGGAVAAELDAAAVAPNGRLALAVRDGRLGVLDLSGAAVQWKELGAAGKVRIAWNPASNGAAVWNGDGRVDLWSNLQESARVAALGSVEDVTALAVNVRGVVAAASYKGIHRLQEGSNAELLASITDVSALALDGTGNSLYAASRSGNSVLELADWLNTGAATLLANENAGVEAPEALGVSADGRSLFVANKSTLAIIDRSTRSINQTLAIDFKASRLEPVAGGSIWLLNSRSQGQPLEVLSAGPEAKVFFVPVEE